MAAWGIFFAASAARPFASETASEPEVKAAFLVNFTRFVDWPAAAFGSPSEPFVVGVVGGGAVEQSLRALIGDRAFGGRPMRVRRVDAKSVGLCHIVFIPSSQKRRIGEALRAASGLPVLTVAESEGFAKRGGVINFVVLDRHVRFEINPEAAAASQLRISPKLLQLAILTGERDAGAREAGEQTR